MAGIDEVERFLSDLKIKISTFDMVIVERKKNHETLAKLEILGAKAFYINEINKLTAANYYKGPIPDTQNSGNYWEFGTEISSKEIYIKINYGLSGKPCILISFHFAEFTITYPFA
jgi:hypothetical protein